MEDNNRPTKLNNNVAGAITTASSNVVVSIFSKILSFVDQFISFISNKSLPEKSEVIAYSRPPIMFGLWTVFIFVICGGLWAGLAPLDSSAHGVGTVISQTPKQTLQIKYAGKVKKHFIKQGEIVSQGQVLIELDSIENKSYYLASVDTYLEILALRDRLLSQRDNNKTPKFSPLLLRYINIPRIAKTIELQTEMFFEMLKIQEASNEIIQKQIDQQSESRKMCASRIKAAEERLHCTSEALRVNRSLEKEGFAPKMESSKLFADKTFSLAELHRAKTDSVVCEIEIKNLEMKRSQLNNKFLADTIKELETINLRLLDSETKLVQAEEVFKAILIKAPMNGIINYLNKDSYLGGQNSIIADITPIEEDLVVEVKVPSSTIDNLQVGQKSKVNFNAFNSRVAPTFTGTLISLSPNVAPNSPPTGASKQLQQQPCYTAYIKMNQQELDKFLKPRKLKLITGMGADVQIVTGERTLLRYLLDPILDQSFKAFKER